jgi:hypothetical protein
MAVHGGAISTGHIRARAQLKDFNLFHAPWQIEKLKKINKEKMLVRI